MAPAWVTAGSSICCPLHLQSGPDIATGLVLAQVTADTKSNEITSFAPLLDVVEAVLGTWQGARCAAHPDRSRPRGHHPPSTPDGADERQPADPVQTAEAASLDAGHGRRETRWHRTNGATNIARATRRSPDLTTAVTSGYLTTC